MAELCVCSVPVTQPEHEERAVAGLELNPFVKPLRLLVHPSKSRFPESAVIGLIVAEGWTQRLVISGIKSRWSKVSGDIGEESHP